MSYPRQVIGNQGAIRQVPHARTQAYAQTRSFTQDTDFWGGGNSFTGYPGLGGGQFPAQQAVQAAPFTPTQGGGGLASLFGGGAPAAGGSGSGFNMAQLKNVIDRLGGVEAIVETFTKVQKMVASVQQMAPMLKVLLGSFGKGKAAAAERDGGGGFAPVRKRSRKRTARESVHRRKTRR